MYGKLLLGVARQKPVRAAVTASRLSRSMVSRFVAGEGVESALDATSDLVSGGLQVTIDYLGEDITDTAQAVETVEAYRALVEGLAAAGLTEKSEVSVKLSALGQSLGTDGPAAATERAFSMVEHAAGHGVDVTFDMEDHTTIDNTLETVQHLRKEFPRTGCVLQTMLFRTESDARDLAHPGSRVRLVKGAYSEPASVAHQNKADNDKAYVRCLRTLVEGGAYPMVATHDLRMIGIAEHLFEQHGRGAGDGEFQMLYGIRASEQRRLAAAGRTVRVYVPFGTDWYGYFSRRLAERPANLLFLAKSLVTR